MQRANYTEEIRPRQIFLSKRTKKSPGDDAEASFENSGSPSWARTNDPRINSPLLYRLSYRGMQGANYTEEI